MTRLMPGLCSAALRHLDPAEVVENACAGGASAIEWEARVHCPPGDIGRARRAARLTRNASLSIPSYGSYVRAGDQEARDQFLTCLATAKVLQAPVIRVWAGDTKSLSPTQRAERLGGVVSDLASFCDIAACEGIAVSLEFHAGTFTDSPASALDLIDRAGRDNLLSHWQPGYGQPIDGAVASLRALLPYLSHLHVFNWTTEQVRLPLSDAREYWRTLFTLAEAAPHPSLSRFAMLEFSRDDDPGQVVSDLGIMGEILKCDPLP